MQVFDIITIILFGIVIIMPFIFLDALNPVSNAIGWGLVTVYYVDKHVINEE